LKSGKYSLNLARFDVNQDGEIVNKHGTSRQKCNSMLDAESVEATLTNQIANLMVSTDYSAVSYWGNNYSAEKLGALVERFREIYVHHSPLGTHAASA
jgi:hypothetical protein